MVAICLGLSVLTHWGLDKMAAIFSTTYSNAFSWMKMYEFGIKISLKFVPKGPISNIPALVQIMAWHWPGNKPLSEPMMVRLLTYICVTWPQWVKAIQHIQGYFQVSWHKFLCCSMSWSIKCLVDTNSAASQQISTCSSNVSTPSSSGSSRRCAWHQTSANVYSCWENSSKSQHSKLTQ